MIAVNGIVVKLDVNESMLEYTLIEELRDVFPVFIIQVEAENGIFYL